MNIVNSNNKKHKKVKVILFCIIPISLIFLLFSLHHIYFRPCDNTLVVYCTHDSVYSEKILNFFQEKTGIAVTIRFDTEATKSLGMQERLLQEKENPICDVFWNNEVLGMMHLKQNGLLEPYKGAGFKRIPEKFKNADGYWTGFAARLRVFIINTKNMTPAKTEIEKMFSSSNLSRIALAKPLYGTTLTHYCCLWNQLGESALIKMHNDWVKRKINIVNGNAVVKNLVAEGICDFGWTDTDDFFVGLDAGFPVEMLPVDKSGKTICIPNTVAIIKGTKHQENAKKLLDFLLSEECELMLANSKSRQIPLGPVDETKLPEDVKKLKKWSKKAYPLGAELLQSREKCIKWLKSQYL